VRKEWDDNEKKQSEDEPTEAQDASTTTEL